ncbi:Elicitor-responsive protein 1 [Spatholobus suberectus]|nr:Elicitor-responsive protein 1 [Spatholobus suberectus]
MAIGFMEVQLVKAKGLHNADIFGKMDTYVLIQYKGPEQRSSVAIGQGGNPVWNEKFIFKVEYPGSGDRHKLILKIMDQDLYMDEFVGQAIIHVGDLLAQGVENGGAKLQTLKYRVVRANKSYCGEIDVGVTFTPRVDICYGKGCTMSFLPKDVRCLNYRQCSLLATLGIPNP